VAVSQDFVDYAIDQLKSIGPIVAKRMFGGVGLYARDRFFALISDDVLYLKADDSNRTEFIARGATPFQPFADKPTRSMSYYSVPLDVFEDTDELTLWAHKALAIANPPKPKVPRR
jgi:DNA transformation protein and related proteins